MKKLAVFFLVFALIAPWTSPARAQEPQTGWSATLYQGVCNDRYFSEFFLSYPDWNGNFFTGLGVMNEFFVFWDYFTLGLEGQYVYHYGEQFFHEGTLALVVRYYPRLNSEYVNLNFAVGEGASYATEKPEYEMEARDRTTKGINYLGFETEVGFPKLSRDASLVVKLHHRSSVFKLIGNGTADSNFLTFGLRYRF
ncbi:MAG: hypothetical protein V1816_05820 [Pseudomonadota bacterium]